MPFRDLGQLAVEAVREIVADLGIDPPRREVVDQPLAAGDARSRTAAIAR
jgi:hypothetical protein